MHTMATKTRTFEEGVVHHVLRAAFQASESLDGISRAQRQNEIAGFLVESVRELDRAVDDVLSAKSE